MSSLNCVYEGSSFPGGTKKRGFYDLWQRSDSEEVVLHVLHLLGYSDAASAGRSSSERRLYEAYKRLPELDMQSPNLRLTQALALFSKNDDMDAGVDKLQVALDAFTLSEEDCLQTNSRLSDCTFRGRPDISAILHYASAYAARVLGDCPDLSELECGFGPGASASSKKMNTTARWKLSSALTISNSAFPMFGRLRECYPLWLGDKHPVPVVGSLEFVPKNFKTYRSIMVEPLLNTFVQKGIGRHIRHRLLRKAGIDLKDQNVQRLRARAGSLDGSYATVDLSRASDTVAYHLVMELVPFEWFDLLSTWRTPMVSYKGKVTMLEKFSSMGNGFTFELETLVFKALIRGIADYCLLDDDSYCYGDDITCNTDLARAIIHYFPLFGLTPNVDKTYVTGAFREACGGDYHLGVDVRPYYLRGLRDKGRISFAKIVSFHNFLQRKPWFDTNRLIRAYLLKLIPEKVRRWGPDGYGDLWLLSQAPCSTYLPRLSTLRGKDWMEGYVAKGFVAVVHRDETPLVGDALLPAYLAGTGPTHDIYAVRHPKGGRLRSREVRVVVRDGPTLGDNLLEVTEDHECSLLVSAPFN